MDNITLFSRLLELFILFFVIFDPLASFSVFFAATKDFSAKRRHKIATLAIMVAAMLSLTVLLLGGDLLKLFSTSIDEFRIAGGIVIGLLGLRMALGKPIVETDKIKGNSGLAAAAIIGTPLLTGPAAITAIIVSISDPNYGRILTFIAITAVLLITALIFYYSTTVKKFLGNTSVNIMTTVLGLVTLSWGVKFIIIGIQNVFF